jgi:hypothetical protein
MQLSGLLTKKRCAPMKAGFPAVFLTSLMLAGCCTSTYPPRTGRNEMQGWGDTSVCGIFAGWGTREEPQRSEAVYTPVTLNEYSEYVCSLVDIEDYATCANRLEEYYRESFDSETPPGNSTSGPFAVLLENEMYVGSYRSDPFSGSFRVSNGTSGCKGSYNALYGDKTAVFKVWCDNGERGTARMVRDRYGRDGIGIITMDDGAQGKIIFGPRIAEAARSAL